MFDAHPLPDEELRRTARQMNLPGFGPAQQAALHSAKVLVIGAGGLGCPIMQTLAATGVGHISLIDDDVVDITNIHRQILFGAQDVGRKKTEVAAERLRALQPGIEVTIIDGRMTVDNAVELLDGIDVLIDGSDTFATKFLAADAAEITGTPLVWGSVLRYRGDVALWHSGAGKDGAGLRDLYPDQPAADAVPDCATAGVLGVTTSVVGGLMATEVIKFLTGVGESVPGKLMMYDALASSISTFRVTRDPERALTTSLRESYGEVCAVPAGTGELLAKLEAGEAIAFDVREPHEKAIADLPVPGELVSDAQAQLRDLPAGTEVIVYCASGVRSQKFIDAYQHMADERGIRLTNFPGGVNGLN